MIKNISLTNLLFIGFLVELMIFGFSYIIGEQMVEKFILSARSSGRLSLVV